MAHIQEKQIVYRGEQIKLVRRPHMKNIRVRISRPEGEIVVSCPYGVANSQWQSALEGVWQEMLLARQKYLAGKQKQPKYNLDLVAEVQKILPRCQKITGVQASSIHFRRMHSRWGSCNTRTGRINLSLNLAHKHPMCLEYVLIHELVHLLERNHTPRFHGLVAKFCPFAQEAERHLRE